MKLQEILCEKIDLTTSKPVKMGKKHLIPVTGDFLGMGIQARVYHTGQGVVTKVARLESMDDPTIRFLEIVLKHQDNPFFPKIYHARIYQDEDEPTKKFAIIQMEKLIPLQSKKVEDVAIDLFKQIGFKLSQSAEDKIDDLFSPENRKQRRIDMYANFIEKFFNISNKERKEMLKSSKNPQFKKAVNLLAPYIGDRSDLHSRNWMVRLTKHGPQLVITDPFAPM